ncbi:TetR/AcrR family transcriptional regulator [Pseudoduganella aquatica]|uniref:TetR/AcrR family transcriptional regulator n=1 Tax=Pseudoduganella aquatica TaxID=2660641 RepID=UPI001E32F3CA|nr:TetR/AcrR family transcriptional regulator [Pseudoduganella aquatica]
MTKAKVVDFRQEQEDLRGALRQGMLDAASRLLVEEGPAALTVRKVAEAVNCSTTLLYSIFGGKDGLSNALYLEGCERLKRDFEATEAELAKVDAEQGVWLCARAYLDFSRRNPSYYLVMFGDAIAGFIPPLESRVSAWGTFTPLIRQFERCMEQGLLPKSSPTAAARLLWAALHGIASLELKGFYLKKEHPDELFKAAVRAILLSLKMPDELG